MTPRQRWLILGSLLTATLVAVVLINDGEDAAPTVVVAAKGRSGTAASKGPGQIALDKLQRAPASDDSVADLFQSKSWYVPPPPPKPAPPPPPAPPPMPFSYMGRLVEDGKTTIFLTKLNRNYAIQQGDTLEGAYRVDSVDATRVVFTYLPLNMQQTLIIGGPN